MYLLSSLLSNASSFTVENEDGIAIRYNLLSKTECEVVGVADCKELIIPSRILYLGHELIVTRLADNSCGGGGSYWRNKLQSVCIPNTVVEIGEYAFCQNKALTHVKMPDTIKEIKAGTFYGCHNLKDIELPESVKKINKEAFFDCSIKEIKLPLSLESIGENAFNSIETVYIPSHVNNIKYNSFGYQLKTISVAENNPYFDSRNNCNSIIETKTNRLILRTENTIIPSDVTIIGEKAFENAMLKELSLPASIKTIENRAFANSTLEKINFPEGLETIGKEAFCGCSSLSKLLLPKTTINIEAKAFTECKELPEVIIPENVISVGDEAFSYCDNIVTITINSSKVILGNNIFAHSNCFRIIKINNEPPPTAQKNTFLRKNGIIMKNLVVPHGTKETFSNSPIWSQFWNIYEEGENIKYLEGDTIISNGLKYVIEENNIATICGITSHTIDINIPFSLSDGEQEYTTKLEENKGVFVRNENIRTLIAPIILTFNYYAEGCFYNCRNLEYVECQNLKSIAGGWGTSNQHCAFAECPKLKTIIMPVLKSIGDLAFTGCNSIETIDFPCLEKIQGGAFDMCQNIQSIDLPSLHSIEGAAFHGCKELETIKVDKLEELNIPYDYRDYGTFEDCSSIKEIELPSVKRIYGCTNHMGTSNHHGCFYGCEKLEKVLLGDKCILIDRYTFEKCNNLATIECLSTTPPQLDPNAFETSTYNYATLLVPQGCKSIYASAPGWELFCNIQEKASSTIQQISETKRNMKYSYNLQGIKVKEGTKGIIIHNNKKILAK